MIYEKIESDTAELAISSFDKSGVDEISLMCKPKVTGHFNNQLQSCIDSIESYIQDQSVESKGVIAFRFFISDCANQMGRLTEISKYLDQNYGGVAISIVQQPPIDGSKLVVWAYIVDGEGTLDKEKKGDVVELNRVGYKHIYHTQLLSSEKALDSYSQTDEIFRSYNEDLVFRGLTTKENSIRTWIYVKDVDYNYGGVVVSRREFFEELDMNSKTHFITSTGIEGRHFDHNRSVLMDAYSIGGVEKEQIKFLTAPDHLNPTHEYGVTFERGTSVDYGDRRHIFLSGTASIDNRGEVVHPEQIEKQIERAVINVEALLKDADAEMSDISHLIIYLRDIADTKVVDLYFKKNHIDIPKVLVLAPVCRPGWLIEMECVAIKSVENSNYKNF